MANPVAAYAFPIDPPRRTSGGPVLDAEPVRPGQTRTRPAPLRVVYDAEAERARDPERLARSRPRHYEATARDAGLGTNPDADETLREAGRRRAPPMLSFAAQQIAQEKLPPGAYFENYTPALAAYRRAAGYTESDAPRGSSLHVLA